MSGRDIKFVNGNCEKNVNFKVLIKLLMVNSNFQQSYLIVIYILKMNN